ncbi:hypothetical protein HOA55_05255 [archaeon]|jgi:hypothetical protein|nr:hypothetical protein [archaeon]MBT3577729.1 hypothetical protein [archaeon]MBT6820736.1 hypothetical protein [archaeon]MBT6955892.1 hypothetical protein [archaeon]MBT7025876.1 hypothetical protein [archaeon]
MINIPITILVIAIIWTVFAIILPFLAIPNHGVRKTEIQKTKQIIQLSKKLKSKSKDKTLKNIYDYVTKNYTGSEERYKLMNYPKLFKSNVDENLRTPHQFLACHLQNLIIITLLLNTGQFSATDIKRKETITHFLTIHQHLTINTGKKKYKIDPFFKIFKKI